MQFVRGERGRYPLPTCTLTFIKIANYIYHSVHEQPKISGTSKKVCDVAVPFL